MNDACSARSHEGATILNLGSNVYAVFLAGGSGSRFWPKSRDHFPKQLLKIGNDSFTLVEKSVARIEAIIPSQRRVVVANQKIFHPISSLLKTKVRSILSEPEGKNTAAATVIAALQIQKYHKEDSVPIIIVMPIDHIISPEAAFHQSVYRGVEHVVSAKRMALMGVPPTRPHTGYGYIQRGKAFDTSGVFSVEHFSEKPDLQQANLFVNSGDFLWNSGILISQLDFFLELVRIHLPETIGLLESVASFEPNSIGGEPHKQLTQAYSKLPSISIDNGLLEVANDISVVQANFQWCDLGSWDSLNEYIASDSQGNIQTGETLLLDCKGCTVDSESALIAAYGLEDLVIVATDTVVLVCKKHDSQKVRELVKTLKERGRLDLL